MKYEHRFAVDASQQKVVVFHSNQHGFRRLVPPLTPLVVHQASDPLGEGDRLDFTMWLGIVPIYWESIIHDVSIAGFTDTQGKGPFQSWRHRHDFNPLGTDSTEIHDQIEARLRPHVFWGPIGLMIWLGLPVLFAWRAFSTRKALATKH